MQKMNSLVYTKPNFNSRGLLTTSALILVFGGPFILAHVLYHQREHLQLQFTTMNTGELQTEPKPIESYGLSNDEFQGHWQLLYITPKSCDAACQKQMELLRNIQISLGKDQHRLHLRQVPVPINLTGVSKKVAIVQKEVTKDDPISASVSLASKLTGNSAWIVDPKGFMIMYYSQDILKQHPKGLLEDIRRLLRYSYDNSR